MAAVAERPRKATRSRSRLVTPAREVHIDFPLHPQQQRAIESPATEILYGGAAGGGKSHLMRVAAIIWCIRIPGLQCYLFRRSYKELIKNHMSGPTGFPTLLAGLERDRLCRVTKHEIRFWNGSVISLNHLQSSRSLSQSQGPDMHVLLIDELTHFCVHPDTEAMTKTGWKKVGDVRPGEEVASIDGNYNMEWKAATRVWTFPFDGELVTVDTRAGISMAVTPNHRVVIEGQKNRKWRFERADSLPRDAHLVYGGRHTGKTVRTKIFEPVTGRGIGRNQNSAPAVAMDDWLELLGWYLSEGSAFTSNGKAPRVSIRQTKPNKSLAALLARLPWRSRQTEGEGALIFSRQLHDELKPLGNLYEKRVPQYVFDLGARQIEKLLAAFVAGDGHVGATGCVSIGLANEGLRDDIARLMVLSGYKVTCSFAQNDGAGAWRISASKRKRYSVRCRPEHVGKQRHTGEVVCLTVEPHHNFIARYEGKVFVTGNTEEEYTYLFGRVRMPNKAQMVPKEWLDQFPRVLAGTNPGSIGHHWVKARFIQRDGEPPFKPLTIYDYNGVPKSGGKKRQFISAKLEDNPSLDKEEYEQGLEANKDPIIVRALRDGDWNIVAGAMFGASWRNELYGRAWHVHPGFRIPERWPLWRGGDDGYEKPSAVYWLTEDPDKGTIYVIDEIYRDHLLADSLGRMVLDRDMEIPMQDGYGNATFNTDKLRGDYDSSAFSDDGHGSGEKDKKAITRGKQMNQMGCRWERVEKWPGSRVSGVQNFHRLLAPNPKAPIMKDRDGRDIIGPDGKPLHDRPGIVFFARCINAIRTIPLLPRDKVDTEDVDTKSEDHCFVEGTNVATETGERPIETIRAGDFVWTRRGLRRVKRTSNRTADTINVRFNNGATLTGTPGHPVMTNEGWKPLYFTTEYGTLVETWRSRSASRFSDNDFAGRIITSAAFTSNAKAIACTKRYGRARTDGLFRKDFTCTIATEIGQIIEAKIWSCCEGATILRITEKWSRSDSAQHESKTQPSPQSATKPSRTTSERTHPAQAGAKESQSQNDAKSAAPSLELIGQRLQDSAATRARCGTYAVSAEKSGSATVYNISVEGEPEYYANGILVHNSFDAVRYALQHRRGNFRKVAVGGV